MSEVTSVNGIPNTSQPALSSNMLRKNNTSSAVASIMRCNCTGYSAPSTERKLPNAYEANGTASSCNDTDSDDSKISDVRKKLEAGAHPSAATRKNSNSSANSSGSGDSISERAISKKEDPCACASLSEENEQMRVVQYFLIHDNNTLQQYYDKKQMECAELECKYESMRQHAARLQSELARAMHESQQLQRLLFDQQQAPININDAAAAAAASAAQAAPGNNSLLPCDDEIIEMEGIPSPNPNCRQ